MNEKEGVWYIDTDEQHDRRQHLWGDLGWYVGATLAMIFVGFCAMVVSALIWGPV